MKKILWIDTETTGLSTSKHGIIELGALFEIDGEVTDKVLLTMKPTGRVADQRALEINGYTKEKIKNLEPWENVFPEFISRLNTISRQHYPDEKFILAGQNVSFDFRFVDAWAAYCGASEYFGLSVNTDKNSFINTQKIFKSFQKRGLVPDSESAKLGNICRYFEVDLKNAHTAIGDIEATREAYYKMLDHAAEFES